MDGVVRRRRDRAWRGRTAGVERVAAAAGVSEKAAARQGQWGDEGGETLLPCQKSPTSEAPTAGTSQHGVRCVRLPYQVERPSIQKGLHLLIWTDPDGP